MSYDELEDDGEGCINCSGDCCTNFIDNVECGQCFKCDPCACNK